MVDYIDFDVSFWVCTETDFKSTFNKCTLISSLLACIWLDSYIIARLILVHRPCPFLYHFITCSYLSNQSPCILYFLDDSVIAFYSQTNQIIAFLIFPYIFFYDHILVKSIFSTINIHFLTYFCEVYAFIYENKFI